MSKKSNAPRRATTRKRHVDSSRHAEPKFLGSPREVRQDNGLASKVLILLVALMIPAALLAPDRGGVLPDTKLFSIRVSSAESMQELPIKIEKLQTCSCYSGPRNQIQQKYKFRVINTSTKEIDIGGGTTSNLRLIVAYPPDFVPVQTLPRNTENLSQIYAASPPNVPLRMSSSADEVPPTQVDDAAGAFGTPSAWRVYALAPNPNLVVEDAQAGDKTATFPTYVGEEYLNPGAAYYSSTKAEGVWVFYIPIQPDLRRTARVSPSMVAVDPKTGALIGKPMTDGVPNDQPYVRFPSGSETKYIPAQPALDKYYRVLGIGVFSGGPDGSLVGFSPVPPQSLSTNIADM